MCDLTYTLVFEMLSTLYPIHSQDCLEWKQFAFFQPRVETLLRDTAQQVLSRAALLSCAVQYSAVQYSEVQCTAVQCSAVQCSVVPYSAV